MLTTVPIHIRLDELLSQPAPVESQNLSLKIPMLGNISVSRHSKPSEQSFHSETSSHTGTCNYRELVHFTCVTGYEFLDKRAFHAASTVSSTLLKS